MSDAEFVNCRQCGFPISGHVDGKCPETSFPNLSKKIVIEHKGLPSSKDPESIEELKKALALEKQKREEFENIVTLQAEKSFRDSVNQIVLQFPTDRHEEIKNFIGDDPSKLEQIQASLLVRDEDDYSIPVTKSTPEGKATLNIKTNEPTKVSGQKNQYYDYVDQLFQKAKLSQNPLVREKASREIEGLFQSYERGQSENPKSPVKFVATQCVACGSILQGDKASKFASRRIPCPVCDYKGGSVRKPQNLSKIV